jgi:hypothetical protein
MSLDISDLISAVTSRQARSTMLATGDAVGLQTTAWKPLDPTRSLFYLVSDMYAAFTAQAAAAIRGGFLEYASGGWLTLHALNQFGVVRTPATHAAGQVTLTNSSGTVYAETNTAGAVTVKNSTTGKTYRNTSTGILGAGGTLTLDFLADEAGADSTSLAGDIDTMVTVLLGVTCSNASALIGTDEQSDEELRLACRRKRGAISSNGPSEIYEYIATHTLRADGVTPTDVNRVLVSSTGGNVSVLLAGASGAPIAGDVTLVNTAIQTLAVPLGVTVTVTGATNNVIPVAYTAYVSASASESDAEIEAAIGAALNAHFLALPINGQKKSGGGSNYVFADDIEGVINHVNVGTDKDPSRPVFTTDLAAPAADTLIIAGQVPKLGIVTPTITRVTQ